MYIFFLFFLLVLLTHCFLVEMACENLSWSNFSSDICFSLEKKFKSILSFQKPELIMQFSRSVFM